MKILVTGGAGFIGSHFIRHWLEHNQSDFLYNLDKLTYAGNLSTTKDFSKNKNYEFVKGDICNAKLVDDLVSKVDIVVHFAAESHVDRSIVDPQAFIQTNVLGTYTLLNAAKKHKIKHFHHVSTDEVFGSLPLDSPKKFTPKSCYDPKSPYSASKAASDHLVRAYHETYGLPITISNCSNNYGPFQDPEKFIPRMITNLIEGENIPIYGDGKYVRDWLFVEDHISAITMMIKKGDKGMTYLVGGMKDEVNNLGLARMILDEFDLDEKRLEFIKDRPGHDRRYAVDFKKTQEELGWAPSVTLKEGVKQTVSWYKNNSWWWKPIKKQREEFYKKTIKM